MRADPEGLLCQLTDALVALLSMALGAAQLAEGQPLAALFFLLFGAAFGLAAWEHRRRKGDRHPLLWGGALASASLALWALCANSAPRSPAVQGAVLAGNLLLPPAVAFAIRGTRSRWYSFAWLTVRLQGLCAVVLLAAFVWRSGWRSAGLQGIAFALALGGVAAQRWLKSRGKSLGPVDYNSFFHLVMACALVVLFVALKA
jgi:hypothetical protein